MIKQKRPTQKLDAFVLEASFHNDAPKNSI